MSQPEDVLKAAQQAKADADAVLKRARRWITVTAYAQAYGVCRHTVYKWIREGLLDTYQVGKVRRLKKMPPRTIKVSVGVHPVKPAR